MKIRFATINDAQSLLKIYEQYIETVITFEYTLPSKEEFQQRIKDIIKEYPYLVCEENGQIIGYAYAHKDRERAAYQWNTELSIYMDKNYTSKGLGRKLYSALIELLRLQGVKTAYGVVTYPNAKSENLHKSLGFQVIGTFHNTGFKCNGWHDVIWFERKIDIYDTDPKPIISIHEVDKDKIKAVLEEAVK